MYASYSRINGPFDLHGHFAQNVVNRGIATWQEYRATWFTPSIIM